MKNTNNTTASKMRINDIFFNLKRACEPIEQSAREYQLNGYGIINVNFLPSDIEWDEFTAAIDKLDYEIDEELSADGMAILLKMTPTFNIIIPFPILWDNTPINSLFI